MHFFYLMFMYGMNKCQNTKCNSLRLMLHVRWHIEKLYVEGQIYNLSRISTRIDFRYLKIEMRHPCYAHIEPYGSNYCYNIKMMYPTQDIRNNTWFKLMYHMLLHYKIKTSLPSIVRYLCGWNQSIKNQQFSLTKKLTIGVNMFYCQTFVICQ